MPSLKDLKVRIKSVKSTQKITKAMKMVAASKLKRAREAAEAAEPYADRMATLVANLATNTILQEGQATLLTGTGKEDVHLLIVTTSDRGLCGAFNGSIVKNIKAKINRLKSKGRKVKLLCIGKKGYDLLKGQYGDMIIEHYEGVGRKGVKFVEGSEIAEKVLELYEKGEFDVCHLIYNKFKSAIAQVVTERRLIPFDFSKVEGEDVQLSETPYEYEPDEEEILERLLPKNISVQIYRALLESSASEQGARMTAMDNATRNSGEMIKKLNLQYNRTRQAFITKELIEIISGAEAV